MSHSPTSYRLFAAECNRRRSTAARGPSAPMSFEECWRRDSNPHGAYAPPDFRTTIAFATLAVRSLDFLLAVALGRRPQPQSLYTFFPPPAAARSLARDCHHPDVLRFPRVRLNSRREFPALVLK